MTVLFIQSAICRLGFCLRLALSTKVKRGDNMSLPTVVLDAIAGDIKIAETSMAELKDIISDMKLSGMDTASQQKIFTELADKLRSLKVFYERQKSKI